MSTSPPEIIFLGRSVPFPLPFPFSVAKLKMWTPNFLSPEGKNNNKNNYLFSKVYSFVCMVHYFLTLKFLLTSSYDSSAFWLTIQIGTFHRNMYRWASVIAVGISLWTMSKNLLFFILRLCCWNGQVVFVFPGISNGTYLKLHFGQQVKLIALVYNGLTWGPIQILSEAMWWVQMTSMINL